MRQKPRSFVGFLQAFVVLGVLAFFACQGFAGVSSIYKWKDGQGKIHFTDDPLKIPPRYRSDPGLEKTRGLPPPKSSPRPPPQTDSATKDKEKRGKKTVDPNADKKEKEVAAMRDALSFLKSDVQRYEKYKDYIPAVRHARLLKNDIVAALPAKEALGKKLGEYDSALLKNVKSFLKKSLLLDNKTKDLWPRRRGFIVERNRINEEQPVKNQLIEKLTAKLASGPEKTSSQSKPPKHEEPVQAIKTDKPKTRGAYVR